MGVVRFCPQPLEAVVNESASQVWELACTNLSAQDAIDHATANIPSTLLGLPIKPLKVKEVKAGELYRFTSEYGISEGSSGGGNPPGTDPDSHPAVVDGRSYVQSVHITKGLAYHAGGTILPSGTVNDYGGAINVTPDGVLGCDIDSESFEFSLDLPLPNGYVSIPIIRALFLLRRRVNSQPFYGWEAGEVRLRGWSFASTRDGTSSDRAQLTFAIEENIEPFDEFDITIAKILGHDYVWPEWGMWNDDYNLPPENKVIAVHVNQVYPYADLNALFDDMISPATVPHPLTP